MKVEKTRYPEHDKVLAVRESSAVIGAFLEWLTNERSPVLEICYWADQIDTWCPYPVASNINGILAEYYGIDLTKLEGEKRQMLEELREENSRT